MKKMFLVLIAFVLSAGSAFAQNFEGPYIGGLVGYNSYSLNDTTAVGGQTDDNMSGATFGGIFGVRSEVADNIIVGVEGFVNANTASKTFTTTVLNQTVTTELNSDVSYGFDATAGVRNGETLFFLMAGYGWNDISAKDASGTTNVAASTSGKGIRLGAGAEMIVADNMSIRIQGNWQDFDGGTSAIGGAIGAVFSF